MLATHSAVNIGTTSQQVLPVNNHRKMLFIQNKHASNSVWVKFGAAVINADVVQTEAISFSATPTAGSWALTWNGNATGALAYNISAATLQTALQAVAGLGSVTVTGSVAAGFTVTMTGVLLGFSPVLPVFTVSTNTLTAGSAVAVTVAVVTPGAFVDGILIPALTSQTLPDPLCSTLSVNLLASGANTRVEVIEGN